MYLQKLIRHILPANKIIAPNVGYRFDPQSKYFSALWYFLSQHNVFPSRYAIHRVNVWKYYEALIREHNIPKERIITLGFFDDHHTNTHETSNAYILLNKNVIIQLSGNDVVFYHYGLKDDQFEELCSCAHRFKIPIVYENNIHLILQGDYGLYLSDFKIKQSKVDVTLNYNDDFMYINELVLNTLKQKDAKGLFLFHGEPGTGKSSYLRYLITQVNKKVIYVPSDLASVIAHPNLLSLLTEHPNCVLVIEDSENLIESRDGKRSGALSNILNLCDGLLGDCINIQIIATFNTSLGDIDSALLRKGRLTARYEFKKLEVQKAQALSDHLGNTSVITQEMTLTDIYNQDDDDFKPRKGVENKIGFKIAS